MFLARYAILIDGGFVKKKLREKNGHPASADDVSDYVKTIGKYDIVKDYELLRVYYYDAPPCDQKIKKPMSGTALPLASTPIFAQSQSLYDKLIMKPGFALRMGETRLSPFHWKLKPSAVRQIQKTPRSLVDDDFQLDISQKGVDMRIGLDMARLALRDLVRAVVVVTADADFVPAFKFARREGVKVILDTMGHKGARPELKAHADFVTS